MSVAPATIRYFAWVRSRLGCSQEDITLPADGLPLEDIAAEIAQRSEAHAAIFNRPEGLKAAINKEYASLTDRAMPGDEIAFFPPVTGG